MSENLIKKCPKMVILTKEFDHHRYDAEYLAKRLSKYGLLFELYIEPGTCHYDPT